MKTYTRYLLFIFTAALSNAATYTSSPNGKSTGDGSESNPWPALEESIAAGHLEKLQPGDTLHLKNGYHGYATIKGLNTEFITIAAAPDNTDVRLAQLTLSKASKWLIKDLRISNTFGLKEYASYIVSFGHDADESGDIIIDGCEIFSSNDHTSLDMQAWINLKSGIQIGPHADNSTIQNCYICNTRFAIDMSAEACMARGNVIQNYSGDGIRMTRDDQVAEFNVIRHAFAPGGQGDSNHDDAIQCFLYAKGTGTVRNIKINHNIIIGQEDGDQPYAALNQAIGFFDGPLVNFQIGGNIIMVKHWHGISVFDGQGCTIQNNVVWTKFAGNPTPWIMLGSKLNQSKNNTVTDNYAPRFRLDQPDTTAKRNRLSSKWIYKRNLKKLSEALFEAYGEYHHIAKRHRITGEKQGLNN